MQRCLVAGACLEMVSLASTQLSIELIMVLLKLASHSVAEQSLNVGF